MHGEGGEYDELQVNVWASEIRQLNESIYECMDKHGLLPSPEAQKADAISSSGSGGLDVRIRIPVTTDDDGQAGHRLVRSFGDA